MFAAAESSETQKRDLDCDDRDAIVFKYPAGQPKGYCDPPVASCGFCAPPGSLSAVPTVSVEDDSWGRIKALFRGN